VFAQLQFFEDHLLNVMAILGTAISPYLFFWQAAQVAEALRPVAMTLLIGYLQLELLALDC
jgi:Mn2+/Fe2+ NRAMP family transporter